MAAPTSDEAGIRQVVRALRGAGYVLDRVYDGEEDVNVDTVTEAIEAITAVDEATLYVDHPDQPSSFVFFVLGNDPDEVVCDHGVSLSPVLDPLMERWY